MSKKQNDPLTFGAAISNTNPGLVPGPEPLTGRHVTLEHLTESHYPALHETVGSHDHVFSWWPEGPYSTSAAFYDSLKELRGMEGLIAYSVLPRSGPNKGKAVGLALTRPETPLTHRATEIGLLYGPGLQRTIEGTEAAYLLCHLIFEKLNYRRMAWECNSGNLASKRAAERFGMVYEGTFRQHKILKGRNRDTDWYSMLDSEWPLSKETFETWLKDENFDDQRRQKRSMNEIKESLKQA